MAAKVKKIKINCTGTDWVPLKSIKPFQGKFKMLNDVEKVKLKSQLLKNGLCSPFVVWNEDGKKWALDGHQRQTAIDELLAEGCVLDSPQEGQVPVVYSQAKDKDEAIRFLLSLASTYGRVNKVHLGKFQEAYAITAKEMAQLSFPELEGLEDLEVPAKGKTKKVEFEVKPKMVMCPKCEEVFDAKEHKHVPDEEKAEDEG